MALWRPKLDNRILNHGVESSGAAVVAVDSFADLVELNVCMTVNIVSRHRERQA